MRCHHHARYGKIDTLRDSSSCNQKTNLTIFKKPLHEGADIVGEPGMMNPDTVCNQISKWECRAEFKFQELLNQLGSVC